MHKNDTANTPKIAQDAADEPKNRPGGDLYTISGYPKIEEPCLKKKKSRRTRPLASGFYAGFFFLNSRLKGGEWKPHSDSNSKEECTHNKKRGVGEEGKKSSPNINFIHHFRHLSPLSPLSPLFSCCCCPHNQSPEASKWRCNGPPIYAEEKKKNL